jgi:hypothetical protein
LIARRLQKQRTDLDHLPFTRAVKKNKQQQK